MSSVNNYDNYSQKKNVTPNVPKNSTTVHNSVENQKKVTDTLEVIVKNNNFIPGQKIKASVVDVLKNNTAIVKFRDKFLTAYFFDKTLMSIIDTIIIL